MSSAGICMTEPVNTLKTQPAESRHPPLRQPTGGAKAQLRTFGLKPNYKLLG
ncbi:MAG: hypothetical protein KME26_28370 [Oscillatoria princeps RMCB-10]|nr:hypothetical protein [Oscillatoria princeps RMCB-10]